MNNLNPLPDHNVSNQWYVTNHSRQYTLVVKYLNWKIINFQSIRHITHSLKKKYTPLVSLPRTYSVKLSYQHDLHNYGLSQQLYGLSEEDIEINCKYVLQHLRRLERKSRIPCCNSKQNRINMKR